MKKKSKLLAIAVFIFLGICFWQVTTTPLPCKYLGWLSWWPGLAQASAHPCCPDCNPSCLWTVPPYGTVSQCLQSCGGDDDDDDDDDDTPPQPPDQVEAGQGRFGVIDPQTPDITVDFPPGAVDVPVEVRAAYTDLPPGVAPPAGNVVGAPFLFGAWIRGGGETVDKFNKSVVINVRCDNKPIHQLSGATSPGSVSPSAVVESGDQPSLEEEQEPAPAESDSPPGVTVAQAEPPQEQKQEPVPAESDSSAEVTEERDQPPPEEKQEPAPPEPDALAVVAEGRDGPPPEEEQEPVTAAESDSSSEVVPTPTITPTLTPTPTLTTDSPATSQVAQIPTSTQPSSPSVENQAGHPQLSMYDPNTQAWIKLCGRVDPYDNTVSGAVIFPTALKVGGNALLAVTIDNTPALEQSVDGLGNTTLSLPGSNFSFDVLAGTVEVGTHFEVTPLLNAPNSTSFKLLPTPVDVKACQADYSTARKVRQITQFSKPIEVMFYYDANTLARAGGKNNLTIVSFQNRQWSDLEEFGSRVVRGDNTIAVDSSNLGTFSMAVR